MREDIILSCYHAIVDSLLDDNDECVRASEAIENGEAYSFAEDYLNENCDLVEDFCDDYTEDMEILPILADTLSEYGYDTSDYYECMISAQRRKQILAVAVFGGILQKFTEYLEQDFEDDYEEE